MVMGRITFDGMGQRALPNRTSIILTQDKNYHVEKENVLVMHSVQEVLDWYQQQEQHLFVIGGGQIFTLFAPYLDQIIRTDIHAAFEGDVTIPDVFDWDKYQEVEQSFYPVDAQNSVSFTVRVFDKKEM
ncbi:Dihydrofolate reductase [Streptococcus sp. DD13]|nr:Dihydrofolate reductase [Streptococcus sp. DD13]